MRTSQEQRDRAAYDRAFSDALHGLPELASKWRHFCQLIATNQEISLLTRIRGFSFPASHWVRQTYPHLAKSTNQLPWLLMLFAAVRLAETHTSEELNAAMDTFAVENNLTSLRDLVNALPQFPAAERPKEPIVRTRRRRKAAVLDEV